MQRAFRCITRSSMGDSTIKAYSGQREDGNDSCIAYVFSGSIVSSILIVLFRCTCLGPSRSLRYCKYAHGEFTLEQHFRMDLNKIRCIFLETGPRILNPPLVSPIHLQPSFCLPPALLPTFPLLGGHALLKRAGPPWHNNFDQNPRMKKKKDQ